MSRIPFFSSRGGGIVDPSPALPQPFGRLSLPFSYFLRLPLSAATRSRASSERGTGLRSLRPFFYRTCFISPLGTPRWPILPVFTDRFGPSTCLPRVPDPPHCGGAGAPPYRLVQSPQVRCRFVPEPFVCPGFVGKRVSRSDVALALSRRETRSPSNPEPRLLDNLRDHTSTNRTTTFTNREP